MDPSADGAPPGARRRLVFYNLHGLAVEDAAAAHLVWQALAE